MDSHSQQRTGGNLVGFPQFHWTEISEHKSPRASLVSGSLSKLNRLQSEKPSCVDRRRYPSPVGKYQYPHLMLVGEESLRSEAGPKEKSHQEPQPAHKWGQWAWLCHRGSGSVPSLQGNFSQSPSVYQTRITPPRQKMTPGRFSPPCSLSSISREIQNVLG